MQKFELDSDKEKKPKSYFFLSFAIFLLLSGLGIGGYYGYTKWHKNNCLRLEPQSTLRPACDAVYADSINDFKNEKDGLVLHVLGIHQQYKDAEESEVEPKISELDYPSQTYVRLFLKLNKRDSKLLPF